jgi:hypothetical protein
MAGLPATPIIWHRLAKLIGVAATSPAMTTAWRAWSQATGLLRLPTTWNQDQNLTAPA